jgi:hypothetical protein
MARVVAFIPDLLFGSRVQADLLADGHDVQIVDKSLALKEALPGVAVLIFDLTDEAALRAEILESLSSDGSLAGIRTLAFYSHVDVEARQTAERASFDLVVPRSRMAREGAALVTRLVRPTQCGGGLSVE